jgi:SAM-dependent methyltransferase
VTGRLDGLVRRLVPALPTLSRRRWLMAPLDAADWLLRLPYAELRGLPPNRFRIRVGVGNRLLGNAAHYRVFPLNFWLEALAAGVVRLDSRILDIGCGCGRFAFVLREFHYHGRAFTGVYTGVDVDAEMLDWCRGNFPADRFRWLKVDSRSAVYSPDGGASGDAMRLEVGDGSQDFVLANSLFTHLLDDDFRAYIREAGRVLKRGGHFQFSVFLMEDVRADAAQDAGGRWTFRHRMGEAWVENQRLPEAAVAYERAHVERECAAAGLGEPIVFRTHTHCVMRWRKL